MTYQEVRFSERKRNKSVSKRLVDWKYRSFVAIKSLAPNRLIKRILVKRGGAIGDVLMTLPAIRGLRHKYQSAFIVVETHYPELFELNPNLNEAVQAADNMEFDLYIKMKYEDRYPLREHITDIFCRCAGVPPQGRTLELFFHSEEERMMLSRIKEIRKPIITIQPWAGYWTRNKDWTLDRWEKVVQMVKDACSVEVIQLGLGNEPLVAGAVDWRGKTTLRESALAIKYAALHLSCNSGSQQLAHAVGTPAVVLYGTTHPVGSGYAEQICLYGGKSATPCYHTELCDHRWNMQEIQIGEVVEATLRVLGQQLNRSVLSV